MTDRLTSSNINPSVLCPVPLSQPLSGEVGVFAPQRETQMPMGEVAFQEWCKLSAKNSELVTRTQYFLGKLETLKQELCEQEAQLKARKGTKPKRHRRTADKIERKHTCPHCAKAYGSEGSLLQHVRLKHEDSEYKEEECPSR